MDEQEHVEEFFCELVEPDGEPVELVGELVHGPERFYEPDGVTGEASSDFSGEVSVELVELLVCEIADVETSTFFETSSAGHTVFPSSSSPKRGSPSPGISLHPRRRVRSSTRSRSRYQVCPQGHWWFAGTEAVRFHFACPRGFKQKWTVPST